MDKQTDVQRLAKVLANAEPLKVEIPAFHALILCGLLEMTLRHPQLDPNDMTHQSGKEIAKGIQAELAQQNLYLGEVLEIGWKELFMIGLECEEGHNPFGNFEQLNPGKKYRAALLHTALSIAISWLDEVTDQSIEEVTDTVLKLAEANLADDEYQAIPGLIKKLDGDEFLK